MSDLFGLGVPEEWTRQVFDRIRRSSYRNRYYLLTKQPQNLIKFNSFPDNCWVGVSATNVEQYKQALVGLAVIKAKVKYISFEPLLEYIPISRSYDFGEDIGWVIIGGQTAPQKLPDPLWVNKIIKACDRAGIPVFCKNNLLGGAAKYRLESIRQEFPGLGDWVDCLR